MKRSDSNKVRLFNRVLPELAVAAPYFSMATVKRRMGELQMKVTDATLRQYMSEAMEQGHIHDAGRGWYTRLSEPVVLDTNPLKRVISRIVKAFPLLEFTCWSTEQVNPYMHHLLGKFATFVHAERDLMLALFDEMRGWKDCSVYLNPSSADAKAFRIGDNTIVVRPEPVQAPPPLDHAASVERLLVDLAVEVALLPLMSRGEFQDMARRITTSGRISMGTLARYAQRRKISVSDVVGIDSPMSQIMDW